MQITGRLGALERTAVLIHQGAAAVAEGPLEEQFSLSPDPCSWKTVALSATGCAAVKVGRVEEITVLMKPEEEGVPPMLEQAGADLTSQGAMPAREAVAVAVAGRPTAGTVSSAAVVVAVGPASSEETEAREE